MPVADEAAVPKNFHECIVKIMPKQAHTHCGCAVLYSDGLYSYGLYSYGLLWLRRSTRSGP